MWYISKDLPENGTVYTISTLPLYAGPIATGLMGFNMKLGWRIVAQKWYKNQGSYLDFDPHLVGGDWNHGILWLSRNSWECHHPNWRFVIFFRGVGWNHQPDILLIATFQHGPYWGSPIREDAHCTKTWRALAVRKSAGPVFWDGLKTVAKKRWFMVDITN